MSKILLIAICLGLSCLFSQVGICSEKTANYSLNISVQLGNDATVNPKLIWKEKNGMTFMELASLTIFVFNTDTKEGQTIFFIRDINKGKVTQEDHTIDLGKHETGEYEVWIEHMTKKKKYSNKVIFTIK
jgi:hypothetical protein